MASIRTGIRRIVYGAGRAQVHRMYFEDRHPDVLDIIDDAFRHGMTAEGGLLTEQCAAFYYKPDDEPPAAEQAST